MKIKEFIEGRNVSYDTVRKYLVQHPEKFEGHIGRPKNIVLDDVAVQLLDEKYPVPQPVELVQDTAAREQLQELQGKMIEALETINRLQAENAELHLLQHKQDLLEQNNNKQVAEIENLKEQLSYSKEKEMGNLIILDDFKRIIRETEHRLEEVNGELEKEKNKTWWDKLRGR